MLGEVSKSFKAVIYDRLSSPLFPTFTISWCLWNYKLFFVLFSSKEVETKFSYIDNVLYGVGFWAHLGDMFAYPLLTSLLFLLVYPHPARWIFEYWRYQQKKLKEIRIKIENETPVTVEEVDRIKRSYMEMNDELRYEIGLKESAINVYREKNRQLESDSKELLTTIDTLRINAGKIDSTRLPDSEIVDLLKGRTFNLYFNPKQKDGYKTITFLANGNIGEGRNENEDRWKITNGKLEIFSEDNKIHSRFNYLVDSNIFMLTGDIETKAFLSGHKGQYISPQ